MKLNLPDEMRQAVLHGSGPLQLEDKETNRLYYLIPADQYEKLKRFLDAEEIDPSFFEFEDEDYDSRTANHG
jgi:hypothetical protein